MKVCSKCGEEKELSEFPKRKGAKDGHRDQCIDCVKKRRQLYYLANREEVITKNRLRQRNNKEAKAEYDKQYQETNRERLKAQSHQYYLDNREERNRKSKEYHKANPERALRSTRRYYRNNRKKEIERGRQYRIDNPEKFAAHKAVQYAVRIGKLAKIDTLKCVDCKKRQAQAYHHFKGYTKKHWFSVVPVCSRCHSARHSFVNRIKILPMVGTKLEEPRPGLVSLYLRSGGRTSLRLSRGVQYSHLYALRPSGWPATSVHSRSCVEDGRSGSP